MKRALFGFVALAMLATACSSDEIGTSESAVVVCGQTSVKGLDVYHGDNGGNPIDWNAVAAGGMSFAFMKATEGTTFVDSSFATNWPGVKAAGMVRGAYHFFHSDLDPVVQATFFLATVGPITQDDLLVLDLETTNGQTAATILSHAETFMATVKAKSGTTPILYTSPAFLTSYGTLGAYPLWIANYAVTCPNVPSEWSTYTFWQSTGSGTFAPLSGSVDLDTFNGTLAQLKALGSTLVTADGGLANNDAGASDAASTDATPPPTDASPKTDAATADAGDFEPAGPSGCACTLGATSSRGGVASYGLLAAVALLRRRRQRSGNIANTKTRGARDSADKTSAGGALGSSHDTSAASASPR